MERAEFKKVCQAIEEGEEIYLEQTATHQRARVLYCTGDEFQVRVTGKRDLWAPGGCEEVASSSESPHRNL